MFINIHSETRSKSLEKLPLLNLKHLNDIICLVAAIACMSLRSEITQISVVFSEDEKKDLRMNQDNPTISLFLLFIFIFAQKMRRIAEWKLARSKVLRKKIIYLNILC